MNARVKCSKVEEGGIFIGKNAGSDDLGADQTNELARVTNHDHGG